MVDADRGLSATEVAERVSSGRVNVVPRSNTRTVSQIVRSNVFTRFNALLGAMLAVILVVGPVQDALFGFVLIANAGIGIVQELRAKRTLDRLSVLTAPKAHVVRDGEVQEIPVDRVVLDDVLELSPGYSGGRRRRGARVRRARAGRIPPHRRAGARREDAVTRRSRGRSSRPAPAAWWRRPSAPTRTR